MPTPQSTIYDYIHEESLNFYFSRYLKSKIETQKQDWLRNKRKLTEFPKNALWFTSHQLAAYEIAQEDEDIALELYYKNKLASYQIARLAAKHSRLAEVLLQKLQKSKGKTEVKGKEEGATILYYAACTHENIALGLYAQPNLFNTFKFAEKQKIAESHESLAKEMLRKNDIRALSLAAEKYPSIAQQLYNNHCESFYLRAGESKTTPLSILAALSFPSAKDLFSAPKEPGKVSAIENLSQEALSYFTAIHAIQGEYDKSKFTDNERADILTKILEKDTLREKLYPAARILALSWLKNYSSLRPRFNVSNQLQILLDNAPQLPLQSGSERGKLLFWFAALCNVSSADYLGRFGDAYNTALGKISNGQQLFSYDENPTPTKEEQIRAQELARAILDDPRFIKGIKFEGNSHTFAILGRDRRNELMNKYPALKQQEYIQRLEQQRLEQQRLEQEQLEQQQLEQQQPIESERQCTNRDDDTVTAANNQQESNNLQIKSDDLTELENINPINDTQSIPPEEKQCTNNNSEGRCCTN